MKISILTPDLSLNCLGRTYLLAKILQRHYEVEILVQCSEKEFGNLLLIIGVYCRSVKIY